jgi:hypothetical protein
MHGDPQIQIKYWATSMLFNTNCVVVSFIGGGKQSAGENHRPATSHWQTLSQNVVSSTPHLSRIRAHNISGDMQWLHR